MTPEACIRKASSPSPHPSIILLQQVSDIHEPTLTGIDAHTDCLYIVSVLAQSFTALVVRTATSCLSLALMWSPSVFAATSIRLADGAPILFVLLIAFRISENTRRSSLAALVPQPERPLTWLSGLLQAHTTAEAGFPNCAELHLQHT